MDNHDTLFEDVLKSANIVDVLSSYINVTKKGRNYVALCPFHDDRNPSLMISSEKQIYKCFVCGAGGNAITFVRDFEKISIGEAVQKVASIIGFTDERLKSYREERPIDSRLIPLYKCLTDLTEYYQYCLTTEEGQIATEYLNKRKISSAIQKTYKIGYALQNGEATVMFLQQRGHSIKTIERVGILGGSIEHPTDRNRGRLIFPITNIDGQVIGFSARRLNDKSAEAKYVNSPETEIFHKSEVLYNIDKAKDSARHDGYIYVLEGFMDIFALVEAGIKSTVALMGTFLTSEHLKILRNLNVEIRICLDGDEPGQAAMLKISETLSQNQYKYRIVNNDGDTRDPDDIYQASGVNGLKTYLNNLLSGVDFAFNYYSNHSQLDKGTEREKLAQKMLPIIAKAPSELLAEDYLKKLSHLTGFPLRSLSKEYRRYKNKNANDPQVAVNDFHPERPLMQRLQLAEHEILLQMLQSPEAVNFYQKEIGYFYHDIYRNIANFLIDYFQNHETIDIANLITELELSSISGKENLTNQITELSFEKKPPYSLEHLQECQKIITEEKNQISAEDELQKKLIGKTDIERAMILNEYYKTHKRPRKKG